MPSGQPNTKATRSGWHCLCRFGRYFWILQDCGRRGWGWVKCTRPRWEALSPMGPCAGPGSGCRVVGGHQEARVPGEQRQDPGARGASARSVRGTQDTPTLRGLTLPSPTTPVVSIPSPPAATAVRCPGPRWSWRRLIPQMPETYHLSPTLFGKLTFRDNTLLKS